MGKFKVKSITDLKKAKIGSIIPESDYSLITSNDKFVQFEYQRDNEKLEPLSVKPGVWTIHKTMQGFSLLETKFTKENILEEYIVTKDINEKINSFFNNINTYKKYGVFPKRGMLLFGSPGLGKSCAITNVCNEQTKKTDVAIVIWHTDKYEASEVSSFLKSFDYSKNKVNKFILIAEDIGGFEIDQVRMRSDSSLLSLLDNVEQTFKIPTMVIATTNFISNFLENLTNRPGRFDDKIEIRGPDSLARVKFLEFFSNNEADAESLEEIAKKDYNEFSVAHIKEAFIRSKIYEINLKSALAEIKKEIHSYKKGFDTKQAPGFGFHNE